MVIVSADEKRHRSKFYRQIFRLPALKYCKLSLKGWYNDEPLPVSTNEYSSIEHLIITNYVQVRELDSLLSYVPHLRRLSFHSLLNFGSKGTKIFPRLLTHLTHISLEIHSLNFDQLEQLFINMFRTVEVLRFTVDNYVDGEYMNANRWKQLIIYHIPNLRVFDIE